MSDTMNDIEEPTDSDEPTDEVDPFDVPIVEGLRPILTVSLGREVFAA